MDIDFTETTTVSDTVPVDENKSTETAAYAPDSDKVNLESQEKRIQTLTPRDTDNPSFGQSSTLNPGALSWYPKTKFPKKKSDVFSDRDNDDDG